MTERRLPDRTPGELLRRRSREPSKKGSVRYWEGRRDFIYYQRVSALVRSVGRDAKSIVDVGSNGCPYLDWFDWIPKRVSIDIRRPYSSDAVEGVKADFLAWQPQERFDLCICLQVLEHIPDASTFARKLLASATHVVVSVPYLWPAGSPDHVHDPVSDEKIADWFGREPDVTILVQERASGRKSRRLVCYFKPTLTFDGWATATFAEQAIPYRLRSYNSRMQK